MTRELLFSVTKKDLRIDTFRAGGKGGQNQNKRNTGVRVTHPDSGAVGEARDQRSHDQNLKSAFLRMTKDPKFEAWRKRESAIRRGVEAQIEDQVNRQMDPRNLRVEVKDENGRWVTEEA